MLRNAGARGSGRGCGPLAAGGRAAAGLRAGGLPNRQGAAEADVHERENVNGKCGYTLGFAHGGAGCCTRPVLALGPRVIGRLASSPGYLTGGMEWGEGWNAAAHTCRVDVRARGQTRTTRACGCRFGLSLLPARPIVLWRPALPPLMYARCLASNGARQRTALDAGSLQ